jgi:hypothetical protein
MKRINSVTFRRIQKRFEKKYLDEFKEESMYYLNTILEDEGIKVTNLFEEENEDENIQHIIETGNSLN